MLKGLIPGTEYQRHVNRLLRLAIFLDLIMFVSRLAPHNQFDPQILLFDPHEIGISMAWGINHTGLLFSENCTNNYLFM